MADRQERGAVLVSVTGWAADGAVRAELVDAAGDDWTFVGDPADVLPEVLPPHPAFPIPGRLPCLVVRDEMVDGILLVLIDTDQPSVDGVSRFRVLRAMVP